MYMTAATHTRDGGPGGYPYTVFRGDAITGDMTWTPVFSVPLQPEDKLIPPAGPAFCNRWYPQYQTAPVVGPAGAVWLAAAPRTSINLTRVFRSADVGWHWDERDNGFLSQTPSNDVIRTVAAPSDSHTAYVVTSSKVQACAGYGGGVGPTLLHVTRDDGQTWTTLPLPDATGDDQYGAARALIVDPTDSADLFFLPKVGNAAHFVYSGSVYPAIWRSRDGGRTWVHAIAQTPLPGGHWHVDQSFATHPIGRSARLYVHLEPDSLSFPPGQWFQSLDQGVTWQPLPLPQDSGNPTTASGDCYRPCYTLDFGISGSFLAADPTNPDVLVWSDGGSRSPQDHSLELIATTDGFAGSSLQHLRLAISPSEGATADSLQTDAAGDFVLALQRMRPSPALPGRYGDHLASTIIAFRPSAVAGTAGTVALNLVPPFNNRPPLSAPPRASLPTKNASQKCQLTAGPGGTLAFDGRYLDFAQANAAPGVIFRGDGATCQLAPPLVLRPTDFPSRSAPTIQALTYDATYRWPSGRMGAILATAPPGFDSRLPATYDPIYAIDPVTAASVLLMGVNTASTQAADDSCSMGGSSSPTACGAVSFFAFDLFRQGIWSYGTPPGGGNYNDPHPGFLALDGSFHDDCFSTFDYHQGAYDYDSRYIAAATVGGDAYLYVLTEDDDTIFKVDERDCSIVSAFRTEAIGENALEEEQIACDPLTLGAPVLWTRNSSSGVSGLGGLSPDAKLGANEAKAWPAPDAYCPFPTHLTYSGPTIVKPGAPVTLCFALDAALAGQWQALNGEPITVQLGGVSVGQPLTDPSGRACVATTAPVTPGLVTVQGNFAGTNAYLPSSAEGALLVLPVGTGHQQSGVALPPPSFGGLPLPQPVIGQQPNVAPGTEPVGSVSTQVEAQAQAQAQAQSQSQSQAQSVAQAQPGVMVQRQKRTQIATQEQNTRTNVAYEARALRHTRPAPAVAVAVGLMMLGFGLVARRPRWAMARARPNRRRP